ncbi:MAG: polysaccharide deacetylase family protein [Patescibacteria group bacterium]
MSTPATQQGTLVISLDFELMWGMFDKVTHEEYGTHLDGVWEAIPLLLRTFRDRDIHATWATVGLLMHEGVENLFQSVTLVKDKPHFEQPSYSAYFHLHKETVEKFPQRYLASELVRAIVDTPYQELASHTFAHFYCKEAMADTENAKRSWEADIQAQTKVSSIFQREMRSIVFPRNQWTSDALVALQEHGYKVYRGTESHLLYRPRKDSEQHLGLRGLRLLDAYLNLSGHHTYDFAQFPQTEKLINVPASRFLRPYSRRLAWLEPLKLARITSAMTHAAKHGEVFHLWWHPHNFGVHQKENIAQLTHLLDHFAQLEKQYGMTSRTMYELSTHARAQIDATT